MEIEIDAVCVICEEEDFIESDASNQLLNLIRGQFKSSSNNFEKFFVKSYKNNSEFENICKEYRTNSKNRMWYLLNKVFERSRKINIVDNLENIYRFADWPNKVNFDLELEIFECALACDSTKNNPESHDILVRKKWTQLENSKELKIKNYGYVGKCYFKHSYDNDIIVLFAHRGTQFKEIGNILADLDIASQIKPDILKDEGGVEEERLKTDLTDELREIIKEYVHIPLNINRDQQGIVRIVVTYRATTIILLNDHPCTN